MTAFYNRAAELAAIERALVSPRAELVIVYGRRGAGKSQLLLKAVETRAAFYYQATAEVLGQQLHDMTADLARFAGDRVILGRLDSLSGFLAAIAGLARADLGRPLIAVIDEFPYLAEADQGAETTLQKWWDAVHRETPNLKVFLAGSHVSWMREHTLSEHGPLQNRRTRQIEVLPLTYQHAAEFYPGFSAVDRARAYAIWGGLPGNLRDLDPESGLWENLRSTILEPDARLHAEPDWLRFTDLRADRLYTSLVRAIAVGQHTPGDIAKAVGRSSATDIFSQLSRLVDMGIVERVTPLAARPSERATAQYHLADPFLAFWYRFVDGRRSMLRHGQVDAATAQITHDLDEHVGRYIFERICREWIWEAARRRNLPGDPDVAEVGAWWEGTRDQQDEIDVVALSSRREAVLFGECKWSNSPMDMRDLAGLRHGIEMSREKLNPISSPWRLCFSRAGFQADLVTAAADPAERILLVDVNRLYEAV